MNHNRIAKIQRDRASGYTIAGIAREVGLTVQEVRVILKEHAPAKTRRRIKAAKSARDRRLYVTRKRKGLCTSCTQPVTAKGDATCEACRRYRRKQIKRRRLQAMLKEQDADVIV